MVAATDRGFNSSTKLLRVPKQARSRQKFNDSLHTVTANIVEHTDTYHRENPEFQDIWRCVNSSPELRALNCQDTLEVARQQANTRFQSA